MRDRIYNINPANIFIFLLRTSIHKKYLHRLPSWLAKRRLEISLWIFSTLRRKLSQMNGKFAFVCAALDMLSITIVNFPFLSSNIPSAPAYVVYVSQLIRYGRACSNYQDFMERGKVFTTRLLSQEYQKTQTGSNT